MVDVRYNELMNKTIEKEELYHKYLEVLECKKELEDVVSEDADKIRASEAIGHRSLVGLGAVVLKNVSDDTIVAGVPAKEINRNK